MNIRIKKIIAALLAAVMLLCLTSCGTSAGVVSISDTNGAYENLTWTYTKDTKTLAIHGAGAMPNASSSTDVGWSSVRLGVEKVVIDSAITTVGDYAFYYMPYLKEININAGTTYVGKFAFAFCSSLTTMILPDGVTEVGDSAFEACSALNVVKLPASTAKLGARAFSCCSALETVQCAGKLERINDRAFYNCSSLAKLILSSANSSVEASANAFENCPKNLSTAIFNDSEDATATIRIEYVDENGNPMAGTQPKELKLGLGQAYSEVSPVIENYEADILTVTGTANGIDESFRVTYKYKAPVESTEENEAKPEEPKEEAGIMDVIAIIIFALVIIGIGVAAFFLVRADKKGNNSTTVRKNDGGAKNAKNGKDTKKNKK